MRKTISLLLAMMMVFSLFAMSASAEDSDDRMQIISCPEQEFSTLCSPDYTWQFSEKNGITIYTEHENSIPYVLVFRSEDWIVEAAEYLHEQYTPHMQKQYGEDLVSYKEYDSVTIGGRDMPAAVYTYRLQGYLIDMIRAMDTVNGHTVIYTAKFIQGNGDATFDALETAVENYRPYEDYYTSDFYAPWRYLTMRTEDGDTIYIFNGVFLTIPASWNGKYDIEVHERGVSFYHSLSRRMWSRDGYVGGHLFSLCWSETQDYQDYLPSYDDVGAGAGGYYYLVYPSDYQAYQSIPTIRQEYDDMWADIDFIPSNTYSFSFPAVD